MNTRKKSKFIFCQLTAQRLLWGQVLTIFLLTTTLLFCNTQISLAQSDSYPDNPRLVNINATLVDAPDNESGIGLWLVVDDDNVERNITATEETYILLEPFSSPAVDDNVDIFGFEEDNGSITALFITIHGLELSDFYGDSDEADENDSDTSDDDIDDYDIDDYDIDDYDIDDYDIDDYDIDDYDIDTEFDVQWQKIAGVVISVPSNETVEGQWIVETAEGEEVEVTVDDYTYFDETIPTSGDEVLAKGFMTPEGIFIADEFTLRSGNIDDDLEIGTVKEWIGIITDAPNSTTPPADDEIEEWTIETTDFIATILVSADTTFEPYRPSVGERVSVLVYETEWDIEALEIAQDQYETGEIVVRLETGTISQTIASRYNLFAESTVLSSGGIYKFASFNPRAQRVQQIVNVMAADPDIIWAERNAVGELPIGSERYRSWAWGVETDPKYENQTAYQQINLDLAHTQYLGDGAVIAVLDTGVDLDHPALQSHLVQGWDMIDDDSKPDDEGAGAGWGHGTHVSGIIARVAPNSKIMPIRVLDPSGRGNTFLLAYAIEWAVDQGVDVINLSLGVDESTQILSHAIQYATDNGVVVVAAAGNTNVSTPQYPAALSTVVGVAAVDSNNEKAAFSNFGDWISIAAPGIGIHSTIVGAEGSGYATWSGTSMAAPFVAGAAALVQQKLPAASSHTITKVLSSSNIQSAESGVSESGTLLDVAAAVGVIASPQNEQLSSSMELRMYLPVITK